jgi:hypothetical protein
MAGNSKTSKSVAPKSGRPGASTKGVMVGKNSGKGVVSSTAPAPAAPTAKMKKGGMVTAKGAKPMMKMGGMKKGKC